jgi:hypothetical protein
MRRGRKVKRGSCFRTFVWAFASAGSCRGRGGSASQNAKQPAHPVWEQGGERDPGHVARPRLDTRETGDSAVKRALIGVLAAALCIAAIVPMASASHRVRIPSTITIARSPDFHGWVHSRNRGCRIHRVVRLWHRNRGGHFQLVGQTTTNRHGRWLIATHAHTGRYFAHVRRKTTPRVICRSHNSRTIAVHGG